MVQTRWFLRIDRFELLGGWEPDDAQGAQLKCLFHFSVEFFMSHEDSTKLKAQSTRYDLTDLRSISSFGSSCLWARGVVSFTGMISIDDEEASPYDLQAWFLHQHGLHRADIDRLIYKLFGRVVQPPSLEATRLPPGGNIWASSPRLHGYLWADRLVFKIFSWGGADGDDKLIPQVQYLKGRTLPQVLKGLIPVSSQPAELGSQSNAPPLHDTTSVEQ